MAFSIKSESDRDRLWAAIDKSHQRFEYFRTKRYEMITRYVGDRYSDKMPPDGKRNMIGLMKQAGRVNQMQLASGEPRAHVSTFHDEFYGFALSFESALNRLLKVIKYGEEHRLVVTDAFLSGIGVTKVYRRDETSSLLSVDEWAEGGLPYANHVSLDDMVFDFSAKKQRELSFVKHRYRLPMENVKKSERFELPRGYELTPTERMKTKDDTVVRSSELSANEDIDQYRDEVWLHEIWLPHEGKCYTFLDDRTMKPIHSYEWDGPEGGPWEFLTYMDVPDNFITPSEAEFLEPMDEALNSILRKLVAQADRSKVNMIFSGNAQSDAERVQSASDGDVVKVNNVQDLAVKQWDGPDQKIQALYPMLAQVHNKNAGNPDMLLGLAAQSPTATQDELIESAASEHEQMLEMRVSMHLSEVFKKLGHELWEDPSTRIKIQKSRYGVSVNSYWQPKGLETFPGEDESRFGNFLDYNFEIEPYSFRYQSPQQKWQKIERFISNPMIMQMIQQQGGRLDSQELLETYAKTHNVPEILGMIEYDLPPSHERPEPSQPLQSPTTTRHNVRHNVRQNPEMDMAVGLAQQSGRGGDTAA